MASGRLDVRPLISHRFPVEQAPDAYRLITGDSGEEFLGVLMTYPYEDESEVGEELIIIHEAGKAAPAAEVRLGVLGAGNFATAVLLPVIHNLPGLAVHGIISASGLNARHAADRFGFRYAGSDPGQVLEDTEINTVAILTRHHLHAKQTLAALKAGKHVFCEKPLALDRGELEDIEAALRQPDAPLLTVGFNRRFAPLAQKMKDFLSPVDEPLIASYRVNAGYIPLTHWVHNPEQGGGRIIGEGCHFIDFLTFLVGAPPVSVTTIGLPDGDRYREDNVILTFRFPEGSVGSVHYVSNGDKAFAKERVEAFKGGRVAVLDDFRSLEMVHAGHRRVLRSRMRQDKGHQAEWVAFIRALRKGGPPTIPYAQISGVTRASFAAVQALRQGEIVQIP
jgi:predicted dehydrogenase